jgi:hypothetical protein
MSENPPTGIELDTAQDYERLKRAYNIACSNIAEINDHREKLTETLGRALTLVEHLLSEMRVAGVTPSSQAVFTKAGLDQSMRKLLRKEQES